MGCRFESYLWSQSVSGWKSAASLSKAGAFSSHSQRSRRIHVAGKRILCNNSMR